MHPSLSISLPDPRLQLLERGDHLYGFDFDDREVTTHRLDFKSGRFNPIFRQTLSHSIREVLWFDDERLLYVDTKGWIRGFSEQTFEVQFSQDESVPLAQSFEFLGWNGRERNYRVRLTPKADDYAVSEWRVILNVDSGKVEWVFAFEWNARLNSPELKTTPSNDGHEIQFDYTWENSDKIEIKPWPAYGKTLLTTASATVRIREYPARIKCGASGFVLVEVETSALEFFNRQEQWKALLLESKVPLDFATSKTDGDAFCLRDGIVVQNKAEILIYRLNS